MVALQSRAPLASAFVARETGPGGPPKPRLLDRVREAIRARHYSRRTEHAYVAWIRRYIVFHGKRHPAEMGAPEITRFLTWLAVHGKVAASTQNQALGALLFLYREVLELDVPWLDGLVRARRAARLPVVLSRKEVRALLERLDGAPRLMAYLLYGAGLRLLECCRLRVQDVDFGSNQLVVRGGKGDKDRVTMLPAGVKADRELPTALGRKYPNAGREWVWQWVFPATRIYVDGVTGRRRRHHLHESVVQRAVRQAALKAGIAKRARRRDCPRREVQRRQGHLEVGHRASLGARRGRSAFRVRRRRQFLPCAAMADRRASVRRLRETTRRGGCR